MKKEKVAATAASTELTLGKKKILGIFNRPDLSTRKANKGWFFVLPFVLGLLAIYIPILVDSIWFSFNTIVTEVDQDTLLTVNKIQFEGLKYYKEALTADSSFVQTLLSGVEQLVLNVPAIVIFSLFIAVILNQKMLGRAAFRAIFFIPVILATGMLETINAMDVFSDSMEEGVETGGMAEGENSVMSFLDLSNLFQNMAIGSGLVTYVQDLVKRVYDIVNDSGVQMLIFLAGLQSISPSIYEASQIEGASSWETFWKITFPMISPMLLVNAIYTIIDSFTKDANLVMDYITTTNVRSPHLATAMSWIYFVVVLLIVAIFALVASMFVFYQKRD